MARVRQADLGNHAQLGEDTPLPSRGALRLEARMDGGALRFAWAADDGAWSPLGPELDATLISDERVREGSTWGFTGGYAVLCAQNSGHADAPADFDWFELVETKD